MRERADQIEPLPLALNLCDRPGRLGDEEKRADGEGHDEHGEESEEPPPGCQLTVTRDVLHKPSDQRATDIGERAAHPVEGERLVQFLGFENGDDEAERSWDETRSGDTADGAKDEEGELIGEEGDDEVEDAEGDEAVGEDGLCGVQVGDAAPEEEEGGEGDGV